MKMPSATPPSKSLTEIAVGLRNLKGPGSATTAAFGKKNQAQPNSGWWRAELISAPELCDQHFPAINYVVPGLFPEGVTLFASRPKLGKSWWLLQVGTAIATGTTTLAAADVSPLIGDVLYLALEDNRRRLQRRLRKYFGPCRENWPVRLYITTRWKRLDQGGLEAIKDWCKAVGQPTLIMIDTLKKIRAPKRSGQTDYDADYEACQGLQELASTFGIGIIVAHHDRKMGADDVFDTVSGTLGLTGGVDTVALLKRSPLGITLHVEGRDLVDTIEKAVAFDRDTCRWTIIGDAVDIQQSGERQRILSALQASREGLHVSEIVARASLTSRGAADKLLGRMHEDGSIVRIKRGLYALPGTAASTMREKREKVRSTPNLAENQSAGSESPNLPHLPRDLNGPVKFDPTREHAWPELPNFLVRRP
jgi:hypothetical protein